MFKMGYYFFSARFNLKETNRRTSSTMKVPRVSLAWIMILVLVSVIIFFGYHILSAYVDKKELNEVPLFESYPTESFIQPPTRPAPIYPSQEVVPMPSVPAQTEEDLREPEPLQQTPPDAEYGEPHHIDPLERPVHSISNFGDNLRHPEQTIEVAPPLGTSRIVPSGLGSEKSAPGGNRPTDYTPEMAQNGGEFMSGILAFDGSDGGGIGYSMI
jgi:hypothetical protein